MILLALAAATSAPTLRPLPLQAQQAIIAKMDDKLLDGKSARYRWPKENPDGISYCAWVNAKNSAGAYTGWTPFCVLGSHAYAKKGVGPYRVSSTILSGPGGDLAGDVSVSRIGNEIGFDFSGPPPENP